MPRFSKEEIQLLIANDQIRYISIDTCIFERHGFHFRHGVLKSLEQFAQGSTRLLLTDVIVREVESHLQKNLDEKHEKLASLSNGLSKLGLVSADKRHLLSSVNRDYDAKSMVETFMEKTSCFSVCTSNLASSSELLARYFNSSPPFNDTAEKKHEFPDAFSLLALEAYGKINECFILLVSTDIGWRSFSDASEKLILVPNLGTALSFFQTPESIAIKISGDLRDGEYNGAIMQAAKKILEEYNFPYSYISSEFSELEAPSIHLRGLESGPSHLLSICENKRGAIFEVHLTFDCQAIGRVLVKIEDTKTNETFSFFEKEIRTEFGLKGFAYCTFTFEPKIKIELIKISFEEEEIHFGQLN